MKFVAESLVYVSMCPCVQKKKKILLDNADQPADTGLDLVVRVVDYANQILTKSSTREKLLSKMILGSSH